MTTERPAPAATPAATLRDKFEAAGGKPSYVRSMFDRIAGVYDLMNRVMTGGMDVRWRDLAARQVALGPGQVALDLGTGTGDLAIAVARRGAPGSRVVGVDFAPEMLAHGERKLERLGLSERITLQVGDGEHLDFPDNSFDACCSAWVVRNLADLSHGFEEMLRVVRPGGRVVCLEMSHPYNRVFAAGFHFYFDHIVPLLGRLIGKAFEAYSYLPSSVTTFPAAPALKRLMEQVGWTDVHYTYLMGGVVAIHSATKPAVIANAD